jgi:hypothetical protein
VVVATGLALLALALWQPVTERLSLQVKSVERATNVTLQDCPPGENTVRAVIRPVEQNEFVTVTLDVKVLSAGGAETALPGPVLYDAADKPYKTAQAFGQLDTSSSLTCSFSFRVPKGTKISRVAIGDASIELSGHEK